MDRPKSVVRVIKGEIRPIVLIFVRDRTNPRTNLLPIFLRSDHVLCFFVEIAASFCSDRVFLFFCVWIEFSLMFFEIGHSTFSFFSDCLSPPKIPTGQISWFFENLGFFFFLPSHWAGSIRFFLKNLDRADSTIFFHDATFRQFCSAGPAGPRYSLSRTQKRPVRAQFGLIL